MCWLTVCVLGCEHTLSFNRRNVLSWRSRWIPSGYAGEFCCDQSKHGEGERESVFFIKIAPMLLPTPLSTSPRQQFEARLAALK